MKWSHYDIHTHCREELQQTPVSKQPQVSSHYTWPYLYIWEILRFTVTQSHQHADYEGELCRVCLHVLLCSSAISLLHLSPEGTSNPVTDLNKGNGSKASIPLILGSQGEQKSFLSTLQGLQRVQQSKHL